MRNKDSSACDIIHDIKEENIMEIRKTKPEELELVMKMYADARAFMAGQGNPTQWGTSYPPRELIEQDIEEENSYVCVACDQIAAVFYYKPDKDEDYAIIYEGQWISNTPYGVVHRITSNGTVKGAASYCLSWALMQCGHIRIDTHTDNLAMQGMLKKNGFRYCGIIYLKDGTSRIAYEKEITA